MMPPTLLAALTTALSAVLAFQEAKPEPSAHHVFINHEFVWTYEMVGDTPVVNVITFVEGEWPLRPQQLQIHNQEGRRARVKEFSMDTGTTPYQTSFFRVLGNSFIGIDLLGDFKHFAQPVRVEIDLGEHRYQLTAIDPLGFETLAQKLNQVNYDSPDVREDFHVLGIEPVGKRIPRPRRR